MIRGRKEEMTRMNKRDEKQMSIFTEWCNLVGQFPLFRSAALGEHTELGRVHAHVTQSQSLFFLTSRKEESNGRWGRVQYKKKGSTTGEVTLVDIVFYIKRSRR